MWNLVNNNPFALYIKLGILAILVVLVSFTTYKVTVWKETSSNAAKMAIVVAKMAIVVAEKATLQSELDEKQFSLDLLAANSELILANIAENKQRIAQLNTALNKKQKSVAAIKASDCSSALREIIRADN